MSAKTAEPAFVVTDNTTVGELQAWLDKNRLGLAFRLEERAPDADAWDSVDRLYPRPRQRLSEIIATAIDDFRKRQN